MTKARLKALIVILESRMEIVGSEKFSSSDVRLHLLHDVVWILKQVLKAPVFWS